MDVDAAKTRSSAPPGRIRPIGDHHHQIGVQRLKHRDVPNGGIAKSPAETPGYRHPAQTLTGLGLSFAAAACRTVGWVWARRPALSGNQQGQAPTKSGVPAKTMRFESNSMGGQWVPTDGNRFLCASRSRHLARPVAWRARPWHVAFCVGLRRVSFFEFLAECGRASADR